MRCFALACLLACACASALDEQLLPEKKEMPAGAVTSPPPGEVGAAERPRGPVTVSAERAAALGLPPMTVSFAAIPRGVEVRRRLEGDTFLELAGPASRPLSFAIVAYGPASPADLPRLVQSLRNEAVLGAEGSVIIAGARRYARAYAMHEGAEATHGCAIMVPMADDPERGALVMISGPSRVHAPSCDRVLARPSIDILLDGLTIR